MARQGIDGELMLRWGAKVWIESVCVHGPFHGDMHAGNIWFLARRAGQLPRLRDHGRAHRRVPAR